MSFGHERGFCLTCSRSTHRQQTGRFRSKFLPGTHKNMTSVSLDGCAIASSLMRRGELCLGWEN